LAGGFPYEDFEKEPVRVFAGGTSDKLAVQATLRIETAGEYKP